MLEYGARNGCLWHHIVLSVLLSCVAQMRVLVCVCVHVAFHRQLANSNGIEREIENNNTHVGGVAQWKVVTESACLGLLFSMQRPK